MKSILFLIIFSILIISLVSAEVDKKLLDKNIKENIFKQILEKFQITGKISKEINKTNPEVMNNLTNVCEKTSGARTFIFILTILTIIGWIYFYPAGIALTAVEILAILNYFCWFSF
ncbi:hypothetical protein HNV12_01795 [Methanococcoides sp. SA1]|nr:hypothetical protein [Methanococcoides sp. SA1]